VRRTPRSGPSGNWRAFHSRSVANRTLERKHGDRLTVKILQGWSGRYGFALDTGRLCGPYDSSSDVFRPDCVGVGPPLVRGVAVTGLLIPSQRPGLLVSVIGYDVDARRSQAHR
jgi:hypothetical protein